MTAEAPPVTEAVVEAAGPSVVLVDARPDRRAVMRQMFQHSAAVATVVGEADGATDAMVAVEQHSADLVVIDLPPDVQVGLDAVSALDVRFPDLAILVCSFNSDPAVRQQALDAGADGYLVKPVSAREVVAAFQGIAPGTESVPSPAAAR
jgi:DNA-binding NarL/FixJ family response regulator